MTKTLIYHLYAQAWFDIGGIPAATRHLPWLKELGVDVVWFGPMFKSPGKDQGYDVEDYFEIDPRLGTKESFKEFVESAHQLGMEVIIDLIPSHTSDQHIFFQDPRLRQKYYIWSKEPKSEVSNLFDGKSIWKYHEEDDEHYAYLFHRGGQPALKWLPRGLDGDLNWDLVAYFHRFIDYWMQEFGVDGFRVDAIQATNINMLGKETTLDDLFHYGKTDFLDPAVRVLNALFGATEALVIMECLAPMGSGMIQYYLDNTPVDFVMEITMKDEVLAHKGIDLTPLAEQAKNPGCVINLTSHDSEWFSSRSNIINPFDEIRFLCQSNASAICLYQGEDIWLKNPTRKELTSDLMVAKDAQAAMRYASGEDLNAIWPSRAATRLPLPLGNYKRQKERRSPFNTTKELIKNWKHI